MVLAHRLTVQGLLALRLHLPTPRTLSTWIHQAANPRGVLSKSHRQVRQQGAAQ